MKPIQLKVCGLLTDKEFHIAKTCAEDLHSEKPEEILKPEIQGLLGFEWDIYINEKRKELRGEAWAIDDKVIIFIDDCHLGGPKDLFAWAEEEHHYENFRPEVLYETLAEEAYKNYLKSSNHKFAYLDITIGEKSAGRLLIELFSDKLPKTCENFLELCEGNKGESERTEFKLHYKDSIFHRIVTNGWIQGGDIWMKKGDGGESIHGLTFEDENFSVSHVSRGIIGMANKGRHTNGSQFYITLGPAKWMDAKYVAFGKIIEGSKTLFDIESINTLNERPIKEVRIAGCGAYEIPNA